MRRGPFVAMKGKAKGSGAARRTGFGGKADILAEGKNACFWPKAGMSHWTKG
jgi:hypothetical protein